MNRSEVRHHLESNSFEFTTEASILPYGRYVVDRRKQENQGRIIYEIINSGGTRVTISAHKALPSQPFLILKELLCGPREHVYKAVDISTMERLTENFL